MQLETMKTCSKCGQAKPVGEFGIRNNSRDGKNEWCKECVRESARKYRAANREKAKLSCRKSRQKSRAENPEVCREKDRKWYGNNRDRVLSSRRIVIAKNRFAYALKDSVARAKKYGYMPCNATADELEASFTGRCEFCGVPESKCTTRLHIDHDHKTGEFRWFLCNNCNRMLGHARENPEILRAALRCLEEYKLTSRSN